MNTSLFNLINIFRNSGAKVTHTISPQTDCSKSFLHDFYCEAEAPYIANR
jgi:hypothetical protein